MLVSIVKNLGTCVRLVQSTLVRVSDEDMLHPPKDAARITREKYNVQYAGNEETRLGG